MSSKVPRRCGAEKCDWIENPDMAATASSLVPMFHSDCVHHGGDYVARLDRLDLSCFQSITWGWLYSWALAAASEKLNSASIGQDTLDRR